MQYPIANIDYLVVTVYVYSLERALDLQVFWQLTILGLMPLVMTIEGQ